MITDYAKIALKNLRRRKLRAWLTMLGIFISIATIFILISVSIGLQDSVKEQFRTLGTDKFFIMPKGQIAGPGSTGGAVQLTTTDTDIIERTSGVKQISYFTLGSVQMNFKKKIRFGMAIGFPLDKSSALEESGSYKAQEGALLQKGDIGKVMLGSSFGAKTIFPDKVSKGDTITVNGVNFKVKAILKPTGDPGNDKYVYMSIDDFKSIFNNTQKIDEIIVQVNDGENVKDVAARVEKKLLSERGLTKDTEDFTILTPEELLASFGIILNIITAFLLGVAAISLVVGGIGITNTMYTSVLERTKEIGTMKAVGARNSDVLLIFLVESGFLGLVGGIIGVILGFGASKLIAIIADRALGSSIFQTSSPWYLFVGCLAFSFLVGAISGVWPAYNASRIRPVDALRYE